MNNYLVYVHRNKINGKRYVGITSGNPIRRWNNGFGYFRNKHFSDAIKKYGWDNFEHIIVLSGLSKDKACEEEQRLIKEFETQDKNKGYNLTSGGEHFKHSEESKRLMSANRKGKNTGPFSAEHIARIKAHHAGGGEKKAVFCVETGKRYECINDAARDTGINKKQISGCCRRQVHYNTAGGYHWRYA